MRTLVVGLAAFLCALVLAQAFDADAASVAVECERPSTLRLVRFEDGSARLKCGHRLLVRVHVPG